MVKLYCQCGYPIWVSARRNNGDVIVTLQDGQRQPSREAAFLSICPQCQRELAPANLKWRPNPPRYFPLD